MKFAKLHKLNVFYKKSLALLILLSTILLLGCPQQWYFSITDLSDPSHPHFCISRSKVFKCTKAYGVSFQNFGIWESNKNGEYFKMVWGIEAVSNTEINKLIYGVTPEGYKETMKAIPIEIGKIYIMDNLRYFRLIKDEEAIKAEIYSYKEFVNKYRGN